MVRKFRKVCRTTFSFGLMLCLTTTAIGEIIPIGDVLPDPTDPLISLSRRIYIGEENDGELRIDGGSELKSDGGSIGRFVHSSGQVNISGPSTLWDATFLTSPTFHVGVRGRGELHIDQGAELRTGHARVASEVEGYGNVTVDGANSVWHTQGIRVGDKSEGHLTISNGGRVSSDGNNRIGAETGASGSVTVIGPGSTWDQSEYLVVGTGALHIADGAIVSNTWSNIAAISGAQADVTVTGAGSQWRMSEALRLSSGLRSSNDSTSSISSLKIQSGGIVTTANSASVGTAEGSRAEVLIEGVGSSWQHDGELLIGDSGAGTLTAQQGAVLSARSALIGFTPTGSGHASVLGPDTTWDIAEQLSIGMAGSGTLEVKLGARITSTTGMIATLGRGEVMVTDEGSGWLIDDELFVGGFTGADGMLSVANEATVEVGGDLVIGYDAGSVGEIVISSDAIVEIEGETIVGQGPESMATLTIADGGIFDADDDMTFALAEGSRGVLYLEPGGEMNLHGHRIQVGDGTPEFHLLGGRLKNVGLFGTHLNHLGGTLAAGSSPGRMHIQGNLHQAEGAILEVELSRLSAETPVPGRDFDFYEADGDAILHGHMHVIALDGYAPKFGDSFAVLQARTINAARLSLTGMEGFESRVVPGTDGKEQLVLTFVPEPHAFGLVGLILCIHYRRRRFFQTT